MPFTKHSGHTITTNSTNDDSVAEHQCTTNPANNSEANRFNCSHQRYLQMYGESIADPDKFWGEQAQRLAWFDNYSRVKNTHFGADDFAIRWFENGKLNASYNCLDRHLAQRAEQTAIIWEGDDSNQSLHISYKELHQQVCKFANVLKQRGIKKGDVVTIYMPMIPEVAVAMLACTRIGAVHSVVFAGFSPEALAARISGAQSKLIVTASVSNRGGRQILLKENVDLALEKKAAAALVKNVIVVTNQHSTTSINWHQDIDLSYHDLMQAASSHCVAIELDAEDPMFILYTSGSTGAPKGLMHSTAGYLLYAAMTHEYAFDYREGEVYWCSADVGWVTGHSYILYGPLANGATTLMFEGVPSYPDNSRFGQVIEKHQVNQFYTAPTVIRALMQKGDQVLNNADTSSLRILGSVGEPINPEAWQWFYHVFGQSNCPIIDTWWQTETGGMMILPLPSDQIPKPGAACRPFFGVQPALLNSQGEEIQGAGEGSLVIKDSWPGQSRTIWGDQERFFSTYFSLFANYYTTGDGAKRDVDGDYWITGRVDDVINVSGHRLGTAEIESALVAHESVAEAAVVGFAHPIKGQAIYVYVRLQQGFESSEQLHTQLKQWVRSEIGPIATPEHIQFADDLPKTRSGKIMRRILRKIAENDFDSLGDTSTLADPTIVEHLITEKLKDMKINAE